MRLLTFTTLFPNEAMPNHGIFVENRLRHLLATEEVASTVLAPVPFFPSAAPWLGAWSRFARVPRREIRGGVTVHHPRFAAIPKLGMSISPVLLYQASSIALQRLLKAGLEFDAIDAHYLYPDGVAAVWLGRRFGKPVVITARGSDVTQLPDHAAPRLMIRRAMRQADALISVSDGLRRRMVELGAAPDKVTVLRNGVDLAAFRPADRDAARQALGLTRRTLISVGALIERKRHDHTIMALRHLPDWDLLIAGEGRERGRLETLIAELGLGARVRLLGSQPHESLPMFYTAADAMVLASSREGWANVLLESMACGTPVIASDIPGNPEVVQSREAGLILRQNTPEGIAEAVRDLFAAPPERAATRIYAERFSWDETSAGQLAIFRRLLHRPLAPELVRFPSRMKVAS